MTRAITPFHLAFPVDNLPAARSFYGGLMGCPEGRSSSEWIDFDFFGHQIVAHLAPPRAKAHHNEVDGHDVPVPHFGVVLDWDDFQALSTRLRAGGMKFVIEPYIRFAGQVGEQATCSSTTRRAMRWSSKAFATAVSYLRNEVCEMNFAK